MQLLQGFAPVADARSRVLILGSMPGTTSLQVAQYYAHPRNQFWPIMGALIGAGPSLPYAQRLRTLNEAGIALWDVLAECARAGSLDTAIRDDTAVANDFSGFLAAHPGIRTVLFNGGKAEQSFRRSVLPSLRQAADLDHTHLDYVRLPSTSPAHAALAPADKLAAWRQALQAAGITPLPPDLNRAAG